MRSYFDITSSSQSPSAEFHTLSHKLPAQEKVPLEQCPFFGAGPQVTGQNWAYSPAQKMTMADVED